ncbi:type IV pilus assembly protein PilQ [Vreelandella subglaciescola]|jgi:type IV pilus assembly protein PilQ|uniref:Type IV pilus assembly protein PilQ n=2 Tax=Vreelandella subglaciescola TaxID=29571 RepID=A0A1M7I3W3_9GAMM|nr:type IV pilus assembly protein PilQ [Halomonas subglaciescola]
MAMTRAYRRSGQALLAAAGLWLVSLATVVEAADRPGAPYAAGATSGALTTAQEQQVDDIDFRRGADGAGRLEITFNREGVTPRVRKGERGRVVVDLGQSALPDALNQIYDVTDFATPISRIVPRVDAQGARLELVTDGPYAMMSSPSGRTFSVVIEPVAKAAGSEQPTSGEVAARTYTGKRLSLNFQDIEVRSVLATLADFTGLNLVASDSVNGRVTLNLNDVPWDQALDLILQSQGLASRQQGNVVVVAPAGELAALERQKLEARSQQETLAPLVTKFFDVKYARAQDLAQLLRGEDGFGLLTERGRVSIDQRTNTLLIQDTADQVAQIMGTLERLDVAVRQVQIEARIVIARDTASRELGINWGISSASDATGIFGGDDSLDLGGASDGTAPNGGLSVDMGSSGSAGTSFGFGYLSGDILLDLELRALESEGKSQTISQPRIITANRRTATISQGEERAFQSVDGNDNPDTEFKEALLSLEVTPQITPDDRIIMDLVIRNDSFRESEFGGEPPIDTNTIETQVLVDNGQTVVLGGILTTEELRQVAKTPLLGDIPVIGNLFRYTEERNEKVELLVFITPRLLDEGMAVR